MLHIFFLGVLFGQTTGTSVQRPSVPSDLKVVIAAPIYQPDGGVTAETTTIPANAPNVVHIYSRKSVCETAIAGAAEPNDAGFGWRLASQTLSVTDSIVNVSVDWRRVWDRGRKLTNGPSGTVQLKLHPGARIPLDHIPNPAPTDTCRAVGLGLEIRLARTAPTPPVNSALVPLGASAGGASSIDADLWLVQRTPSGAEQAQHQTVRLDKRGGSFTFAPVKVSGDRGEVDVEILGSFERYRAPRGRRVRVFHAPAIDHRRVDAAGRVPKRDGNDDSVTRTRRSAGARDSRSWRCSGWPWRDGWRSRGWRWCEIQRCRRRRFGSASRRRSGRRHGPARWRRWRYRGRIGRAGSRRYVERSSDRDLERPRVLAAPEIHAGAGVIEHGE